MLARGGVVTEGSAGSTAISLATVALAYGCKCHVVIPDDAAIEKVCLVAIWTSTCFQNFSAPGTQPSQHDIPQFLLLARKQLHRRMPHLANFPKYEGFGIASAPMGDTGPNGNIHYPCFL